MLLMGKKIDFSDLERFVTIIGTRTPTPAEAAAAFALAKKQVSDGRIVVSGLADGIDRMAHLGALAGIGDHPKTLALLSTSIKEPVYPKINMELAQRIKQQGALLHCYDTPAPWTNEKFGQKQKRLIERDAVQALLGSEIIAVSDAPVISGGTRWALNYGRHFGKPLYQYKSSGELIKNPNYVSQPQLIYWPMELNLKQFADIILSNQVPYQPS